MIARTLRNVATALMLAASAAPTLSATPGRAAAPQQQDMVEHGQGWYEKTICVGCLVAAGITLYTGAAAWAAIVASPGTTIAAVTACFVACDAAYGET